MVFNHFCNTTLSFMQNVAIRIISRTMFFYQKLFSQFSSVIISLLLALPIDTEMLSFIYQTKKKKKGNEYQHSRLFLTTHVHV